MKTKEKIIELTIQLLNQKGISNVKMRDVSGAAEISLGNLTYHYPKWENLIDDIFNRFQKSMDELYNYFPEDISKVAEYINRIYELQMNYAFIFSDFYIFFQLFPKYDKIKKDFFSERMLVMRSALLRLVDKKYLYPIAEDHDYDLLVKNTWLLLAGWHGFSEMLKNSDNRFTREDFFKSIWNLYVYHLTPRGKVVVRNSFLELKKKRFKIKA